MAAVLRALLTEVFEVVATVEDGEALVALVPLLAPDAIVCDIGLLRLSGLEAAQRLLARDPDTCVVIVTVSVDATCVARALAMGVRGYVAKPDASEELVTAVLAALGRRVYLSDSVRSVWPIRGPLDR